MVQVKLIQSSEEEYRARVAKQENVDALEKSLQMFGTVNEHVELVLIVELNNSLQVKSGFVPPATGNLGGNEPPGVRRVLHRGGRRKRSSSAWCTIRT